APPYLLTAVMLRIARERARGAAPAGALVTSRPALAGEPAFLLGLTALLLAMWAALTDLWALRALWEAAGDVLLSVWAGILAAGQATGGAWTALWEAAAGAIRRSVFLSALMWVAIGVGITGLLSAGDRTQQQ
ncbi:MAG TPA: hypothetical protein VF234_08545, partial [Limnochordia bacterium]